MITEINKFSDILFTDKKTLVLCDIDNTILYFDKDINYFYDFILQNMISLEDKYIVSESLKLYNLYINTNYAKPTDYFGLIEIINNKNNVIIFLTSRHVTSTELTKRNFYHIGLDYDNFNIHYTNYETSKINKGEYLLNNYIDLTQYEDIVFIDDSDFCLESVSSLFPNIKCYKFVKKNEKTFSLL